MQRAELCNSLAVLAVDGLLLVLANAYACATSLLQVGHLESAAAPGHLRRVVSWQSFGNQSTVTDVMKV